MNAILFKKIPISLFIMLFLVSCIDENPYLVNPPPQTASVGIRFLNLSSDQKPRILDLAGELQTENIAYGEISESMTPPLDSTYLYVFLNGNEEFRKDRKQYYIRQTNYTVIALPSADGGVNYKPIDSLVVFSTWLGFKYNNPKALLKVFNAYPDSIIKYTAALGCPNGTKLVTDLGYRSQSLSKEVRSGLLSVSLTRDSAGEKVSHLYNLPLDAGSQYCLLIARGLNGDESILLLDESNKETNPLNVMDSVSEKYSEIRPINFSESPISLRIAHGTDTETIYDNLPKLEVGDYKTIGACLTTDKDELVVSIGPTDMSSTSVSLEVMERYTAIILDTADTENGRAAFSLILEPLFLDNPLGNNCAIRIVHGAEQLGGLTLSLGARDNDTVDIGYSAGDKLASELIYREVQTSIIPSGIAPLTLFTSIQPATLLFSTLTQFEAGETYIIVITNDPQGNPRISIIEDNEVDKPIEYLQKSSFVQMVHLVPGLDKINLVLEPNLTDATVYYTGSLATVVNPQASTIILNGQTLDFTPDTERKTLIVAAGTNENMEILYFNTYPLATGEKDYHRRFVNASIEIPKLSVKVNSEDAESYALIDLPYGDISLPYPENVERKISLFFIDSNADTTLLRADDLKLIFGKKYIIIFGGSLEDGGYTAVIHQEF